jgi:hypothetical protein
MNKKGIAIKWLVMLSIGVLISISILAISLGVTTEIYVVLPDNLCQMNVGFAVFAGWDIDLADTKVSELYFCNQHLDKIEVDLSDVNCKNFINFGEDKSFDIYTCPYFRNKCNYISLSERNQCYNQYEEQIDEACHYRDLCKDDSESKQWIEQFAIQKIAQTVERCIYISKENVEIDVSCYHISLEEYDDHISMDGNKKIYYTAEITKSFYDKDVLMSKTVNDDNIDIKGLSYYDSTQRIMLSWREKTPFSGDDGYLRIYDLNNIVNTYYDGVFDLDLNKLTEDSKCYNYCSAYSVGDNEEYKTKFCDECSEFECHLMDC